MYPLRSITFLAELLFPPRTPSAEVLQKVHHRAFQDPLVRYANFQVVNGGVALSNPVPSGSVSQALLLQDRLRLHEQNTGTSREDFAVRTIRLAGFVLEALELPNFVAQQFVVQSLVNPRGEASAAQCMADSVLRMDGGDFEVLGGTPGLLGIKLHLPGADDETVGFQIRIENFRRDPRSLFLENVGVFKDQIRRDEVGRLGERFSETYEFLEQRMVGFLRRREGRE